MSKFSSCPKCGGQMFRDSDRFGAFESCIQCGTSRDINVESKLSDQQKISLQIPEVKKYNK